MLALAIAALGGGTAVADVVKGTVTFRGHTFGAEASAADAVVVLHGPRGAPASGRATIDQRQQRFVPRVLAVTVGTTVDFPNHDDVHHNVYSSTSGHRFDLGLYPPGETRHAVMETPGVVEVRCSAHPQMEAWMVVSDGPYHAPVSAQGTYRIDAVPAGAYEIEVWHPDFEPVRRALEVPPHTPVLTVDLDLRARRGR